MEIHLMQKDRFVITKLIKSHILHLHTWYKNLYNIHIYMHYRSVSSVRVHSNPLFSVTLNSLCIRSVLCCYRFQNNRIKLSKKKETKIEIAMGD